MISQNNKKCSTWKTKVLRGKHHNKTATKTTVSLYLCKETVGRANFGLSLENIKESTKHLISM